MILVINFNTSVDKRYEIEDIQKGKVIRARTVENTPGGKGIQVANVATILKEDCIATGFLGGKTGEFIEEKLKEYGIKQDFVKIKGDSRECLAFITEEYTVVKQGNYILENRWQDVQDLVNLDPKRVVYLGSGALRGLVQEMCLKNLELTSGRIVSMSEGVLGFRHGPKSIINDENLVIFMNSINKYTNLYDMDLIREIHGDAGNHKLAVISYTKNEELNDLCDKYII